MSIQHNVVGPLTAQGAADPFGALEYFDITKKLGSGHFSVVYAATNRFNHVRCALKKVQVINIRVYFLLIIKNRLSS